MGLGTHGRAARCPLRLWPSAEEIAYDRARYTVRHVALVRLAESLAADSLLLEHAPAAPAPPWAGRRRARGYCRRRMRRKGLLHPVAALGR